MSGSAAWRVFKTVSLRSQSLPEQRRELPTLSDRCIRLIGTQFKIFRRFIRHLPLELQDVIYECAREEGHLTVAQLKESVHIHTRSLTLAKYAAQVTDVGLAENDEPSFDIALLFPRLEDLPEQGISDWEEVTSSAVVTAARGCPNLTTLNISGCTSISLASLERLLALPLQSLNISRVVFRGNISYPIELRSLTLRALDISNIEQEFRLKQLPALEQLRMGNRKSSGTYTLGTVTDARDLCVVEVCDIRMTGARRDAFEVQLLATLTSLRKLRLVALRDTHLSDEIYINIAARCKNLRVYDLARSSVRSVTLHNLVAASHALEELDISECRDIINPEPVLATCAALRPQMAVRFVRYLKEAPRTAP